MFPQVEDARRILVSAVDFDLQTQWAEAEDRQIQAGKQRRQGDAGDNAKPNPDAGDVRHGTFSCKVSERPERAKLARCADPCGAKTVFNWVCAAYQLSGAA